MEWAKCTVSMIPAGFLLDTTRVIPLIGHIKINPFLTPFFLFAYQSTLTTKKQVPKNLTLSFLLHFFCCFLKLFPPHIFLSCFWFPLCFFAPSTPATSTTTVSYCYIRVLIKTPRFFPSVMLSNDFRAS